MSLRPRQLLSSAFALLAVASIVSGVASAQNVTYKPYIQPGDNGPFGLRDQMVITWQTDEASPKVSAYSVDFGETPAYGRSLTPQARVVDNYLSADPSLLALSSG